MPSLKQKALHSITRSHYILSLKRRFCFWYSTAQKLDTDHKINELIHVMAEMHKLGENSEALKSRGAFLSWKPLQNNPNSIGQILNRQRFSRFAKPHARTLIRLCKAIGLKLTGYDLPLNYTPFDPTVPKPTPKQATPIHFMGLGKDLLGVIYRKLEDKDVGRFNQANQNAYAASKKERDERALAKLFPWVAHATKINEARDMLMNNPALLFEERDLVDPKGRLIQKKTLFQVSLGSACVEMSKMIYDCFTHPDVLKRLDMTFQKAEALRDAQYRGQFPTNPTLEPTFDFASLINALTNATNQEVQALLNFDWRSGAPLPESDLTRELQRFRAHFPENRVNPNGLHFPYGDYLQAETELSKHANAWSSENGIRTNCFARFILGGLQRQADPTFARVLKRGLFFFLSRCSVVPSCAANWDQEDLSFFGEFGACMTPNHGLGFTSYCDVNGKFEVPNLVTSLNHALSYWAVRGWDKPADHSREQSLEGLFKQTLEGLIACGPQTEAVPESAPLAPRL